MFSPTFAASPSIPPFSPSIAGFIPHSPGASPYRLPPIPHSSSGHDLVAGIVDKFNSLSVIDGDEESRDRLKKQLAKLQAALDRAVVAREEAEEEARRLRERLAETQREREGEREELRSRVGEWEKKYDKAKERFKIQRARNEDNVHKLRKEFLDKEKGHWRNVALAQEAEEWERKQRGEAMEIVEFLELERRFDGEARRRSAPAQMQERREVPVFEDVLKLPLPMSRSVSRETQQEEDEQENLRDVTPEGPATLGPIRPLRTPAKQIITTVAVDFGDAEDEEMGGEDKENAAPSAEVQAILKTPMTIDRAAALAAIEWRRGRARSFVAGASGLATPGKLGVSVDKRDVSAPAITMSVGRKK